MPGSACFSPVRILTRGLIAWVFVLVLPPAIAAQQGGGNERPSQRVIVQLRIDGPAGLRQAGDPLISAAAADQVAERLESNYGAVTRGRALRIGMLFAEVDPAAMAALRADPMVESVEPDVLTFLADSASGSSALPVPAAAASVRSIADAVPWGVTRVNAPTAWAAGFTGAGVKVGIIDSGIDPAHPDLSVTGGYDFTTQSSASAAWADNIALCNGHGTHVAGTVAARQNGSGIVGVAPGVQLYALKVFEVINGGCAAWSSNQIAAIDWAVANGLKVVNLSIASSTSLNAYQTAINTAAAAGVVVVAAAGNNSGGPVTYPAAYDNAIAVSATTSTDDLAYFSNIGPQLWVAAPGMGITSTMPGGGTGGKSGTSMAAPHVAGVAALLLQANPGWSTTQVRNALRDGASDIASPGWDAGTGWGLVQSPTGGGGGSPLTLAVAPSSRHVSVQQGASAPASDAAVTLSGSGASSAAWTASKRKSWTTLTAASGTGSGTVAWMRNASGLAVGTYVDTITVTVAGATGSPARVIDTLVVTAPPTPLTLAVSPASRHASVQQGGNAGGSSATVTLSGTGASSTAWNASKRKSWTTLTTANGTGSGTVAWTRNASGLAVGTYVDTITVTAPGATGSPARVIDTLVVTAAPTPLALEVSPSSRHVSVQQGGNAAGASATVALSGTGAGSTAWNASKRKSWTTLTSGNGTGSGTVSWTRNASGLAVGTYVDTITVTAPGATGSPARVIDTLVVTAAPTPLALEVSPSSRHVSVQQGGNAAGASATVALSGTGAGSTAWNASKRKSWTTLTSANGTGSGTVAWTRNASGLAVGTYVDTITVTAPGATGSPARVIDTLVVTSTPEPIVLAVAPASHHVTVQQGGTAPDASSSVTLSGTGAGSTAWNASKRKSWTTLTSANGTGSGTVAWTRNASGLAVGTYVDTITVTAPGANGSPATVVDTLIIEAAPAPLTIAITPPSRRVEHAAGSATLTDEAQVALFGDGASGASWTVQNRRPWNQLLVVSGSGGGTIRWRRHLAGLQAGTHVDTITVTAGAVSARLVDTLVVTAGSGNRIILSWFFRRIRQILMEGMPTDIVRDSVPVQALASGSTEGAWTARTSASWIRLQSSNGSFPGWLVWERHVAGLAPGVHVDSIIVEALGDASQRAVFVDSVEVVRVANPTAALAADALFSGGGQLTTDQRSILDQSGNRNGRYDLGDFLSWVERGNVQLNAAVLARIQAASLHEQQPQPAGAGGAPDSGRGRDP